MPRERDERWIYVALVILAVAYVVYARRGSIDLSRLSFDWLKKLGGTASYGLATAFAIVFQIWNKRRLARVRKKWEDRIKTEGQLRQGLDFKVVFAGGAKGSFKADVHLTRSALYVFDRGGRREPMRFPATASSPRDAVVAGVAVARDPGGGGTVQVDIRGPSSFRVEFAAPDAEAWVADLSRVLGRSPRTAARETAAEYGEVSSE